MSRIYYLFILGFIISSCSGQDEAPKAQPIPPPLTVENTDPDLTPLSPQIVYATGWSIITINANWAKTMLDTGAHFTTNRNACGKDAYGALEMEDWNSLAKNMNLAIQTPPTTEDYCVAAPFTDKYMDGTVEVKVGDKNRALYEFKDGQICSNIKDPKVSDDLIAVINKIVETADKEDCPNGWGSGY